MSQVHHVELILSENGGILLENLPFQAGQTVEVIIVSTQTPDSSEGQDSGQEHPLRGSVLGYDEPTETVAASDWKALVDLEDRNLTPTPLLKGEGLSEVGRGLTQGTPPLRFGEGAGG